VFIDLGSLSCFSLAPYLQSNLQVLVLPKLDPKS